MASVLIYKNYKNSELDKMRKSGLKYIIESQYDNLHDIFIDASEDSGNFHAVIVPNFLGQGGYGFILRRNEIEAEDFAISEFEFDTEKEAHNYLVSQVPYVEKAKKRKGVKFFF